MKMENNEIKKLLLLSIDELLDRDNWLLVNNLSEQSITHKLAEYLQNRFPEYNVDCEYNGNIKDESERKKINILKDELENKGLLRESDKTDLEKEFTSRAVFPDIIIHERSKNCNNLCIVEVKKSKSAVSSDYDIIKLKSYTNDLFGNILKYQLGVFIKFITGETHLNYELKFFENGNEIEIN